MAKKASKKEEGRIEYLTVVKSVPPDAGGSGDEEVEEEYIEVRSFVSETARVGISKGLTMNLGNYRSARVDVSLEMPCYPEEAGEMIEHVNKVVEARLIMERDSIVSSIKAREKPEGGAK